MRLPSFGPARRLVVAGHPSLQAGEARRGRRVARLVMLGTMALAVAGTPATAQSLVVPTTQNLPPPQPNAGPYQAVPENVGVAERVRPEYFPIGGRLGSFFLYPTLTTGVIATDNVRASQDDRRSDIFAVVQGRARLQSNFSRHALATEIFVDQSVHARVSTEDVTQYGALVSGRYDISRDTKISAQFDADHRAEDRTSYNSPIGARSPLRFDRVRGTLTGEQALGRFDLTANLAAGRLRYDDVTLLTGELAPQAFRNVDTLSAGLTFGYEFRPGVSALVRGTARRNAYPSDGPSAAQPLALIRDSRGVRVEGGLRFQLSSLLYGEVRAGYLSQRYEDPRLPSANGLSFGGDLLWNVTPLTSVRVTADRRVDEAAQLDVAGNEVTELTTSIDHELLRNVILTGYLRYLDLSPIGPVPGSQEVGGRVGARYLVTRQLSLRATLSHQSRTSPVEGLGFTENRGLLSAQLTF